MIWSRKMVITGQDCLDLFHICETFADWLTGKRKILQESFFFLFLLWKDNSLKKIITKRLLNKTIRQVY